MKDNNPFSPWNHPMIKDDFFAPHNNLMKKDDPFEPWNSPMGRREDLCQEDRDYYDKY